MHNHILNYETYIKILNVLQEANKELEQVIDHVLVPNRNEYLNEVSLFDAISGAVTFIKLFAAALDKLHNIEISPKVISMFGTDENTLLSISSPDKKDELLGTDQVWQCKKFRKGSLMESLRNLMDNELDSLRKIEILTT